MDMETLSEVLRIAGSEVIVVPIWEVLVLLATVSLSMLIHGSKLGILITYVFALHLTFTFLARHFNQPSLIAFGVFGGIVFILGLISIFTDD